MGGCGIPEGPSSELTRVLESCARLSDQESLRLAEEDFMAGRAENVLARLQDLAPRNPGNARIPLMAARAIHRLALVPDPARIQNPREQEDRARKQWKALYQGLESKDPLVLGNLYFARALFSQDRDERASLIHKALKANPKHYFAMVLEGEELWRKGETRQASNLLKASVALSPTLAESWLLLARISLERGSVRLPRKHLETYLALRPLDRNVRKNLVRLLVHELNDGDAAIRELKDLLEADPKDVEALMHLGAAWWRKKDYHKAAEIYLRILTLNPGETRAALNLGNLYYEAYPQPVLAWKAYHYLMSLPPSDDPFGIMSQKLFVPTRLKKIEQILKEKKIPIPSPPRGILELRPPGKPEEGE
ncbi:MAG TPA: tetratricopeptide repeat protein [Planctomycetes bacterium]|nr:tetratricopeptide repeat protein [Planctomycetota bacterium]